MKTGRPWYRKQNGAWYVCFRGKQVLLAKGRAAKAEAHRAFAALLDGPPAEDPGGTVATVATLADVVNAYFADLAGRCAASSVVTIKSFLNPLVSTRGSSPASALDPSDVRAELVRRKLAPSTRANVLKGLSSAYRLATRTKVLAANPFADFACGAVESRGAGAVVPDDVHAKLLAVFSPREGDFFETLRATGARPSEVASATKDDLNAGGACLILKTHKTAGKTGRPRTIYLPPASLELCLRLAGENPAGPLFRRKRGGPWKKGSWWRVMEGAAKRAGVPAQMPYGYRHAFATDALEAGVPETHVAELLGHTSTAMVAKHYGHLSSRSRALRESLERIRPAEKPTGGT